MEEDSMARAVKSNKLKHTHRRGAVTRARAPEPSCCRWGTPAGGAVWRAGRAGAWPVERAESELDWVAAASTDLTRWWSRDPPPGQHLLKKRKTGTRRKKRRRVREGGVRGAADGGNGAGAVGVSCLELYTLRRDTKQLNVIYALSSHIISFMRLSHLWRVPGSCEEAAVCQEDRCSRMWSSVSSWAEETSACFLWPARCCASGWGSFLKPSCSTFTHRNDSHSRLSK